MRAPFTRSVILALCSPLIFCGCTADGVALRIDVRTDWVPEVEFSEIEISLDGSEPIIYDASFDDDFLTGVRVASLEDVKPGSVTVRARILEADGRRLVQRLVTAEVASDSTLTLVITRSCGTVTCPDGDPSATECVGGRCVSPECSPENPGACGEAGCESDVDCGDAPVGCARTICTANECFVGSDFSACAATEFCHPQFGCRPRPVSTDGGTTPDGGVDGGVDGGGVDGGIMSTDAGPPEECGMACDTGNTCEIGIYDCASGEPICVRDRLVAAGATCRDAAGECDVAEECDGESPACPMDGFTATGAACSAGFCDGLGTCSDSCTPGASCPTGNPCETGEIDCSGGAPSCVRSGNAPSGTVCAATENGSFGGCGGFSGPCDESGTRSRTVTDYQCSAGTCGAVMRNDTESCPRSTSGATCGTTMSTSWSGCGGYSGTCDETGTESRMVTTYTCSSATCGTNTTPETRACTRDTDGNGCGTVTYGPWGACSYSSICDESTTRSRDVFTPTCGSGSCSVVTTIQTESCTRDTDGTSCASTDIGAYGTCRYSDRCDESGSRMRTNTVYACSTGSCQGSPMVETDTAGCTRNTDGVACVGSDVACYTPRCQSEVCTQVYACTGAERCCGEPQGCTTGACF